jgi:oligo-1,6-glucosidase
LRPDHGQIWAYERTLGDQRAVVVLNWSSEWGHIDGLGLGEDPTLLLGTHDDVSTTGESLELRPWDARVYRTA